jgi:hypothetical protein
MVTCTYKFLALNKVYVFAIVACAFVKFESLLYLRPFKAMIIPILSTNLKYYGGNLKTTSNINENFNIKRFGIFN